MTSRRSGVAPSTLAIGTGAGITFGIVMYAVAPLGLDNGATNPWLPGSDVDPLVLLAWVLLLLGPIAATVVADRRYLASSGSAARPAARVRQVAAAGLLTSLSGSLFVTVLGTGTIAAMLKAAWLRDWLYRGSHLLYGVQYLPGNLRTLPAIAYGHQITGSADMGGLLAICLAFPLITVIVTAFAALSVWDGTQADGDSPRPGDGGGGAPGPEPAPDSADDVRLASLHY